MGFNVLRGDNSDKGLASFNPLRKLTDFAAMRHQSLSPPCIANKLNKMESTSKKSESLEDSQDSKVSVREEQSFTSNECVPDH